MEKIIAIQIAPDMVETYCKEHKLQKVEKWTTSKLYLGHDVNNIPVYINEKLNEGEIKYIFMEKEYKKLADGYYKATVEEIMENERDGRTRLVISLNVEGQDQLEYMSFCIKGYSPEMESVAQKRIDYIKQEFGISDLGELGGREVSLRAKTTTNEKGTFTNYDIYPPKNYMEIKTDCEMPCRIKKIHEKIIHNKEGKEIKTYVVEVKVKTWNGEEYDQEATYNMSSKYDPASLDRILYKCHLPKDNFCNVEIDVPAKLNVKVRDVEKDGKTITYTNKKIRFDREPSNKKVIYKKGQ